MNILTVCRALPTPADASQGVYVMKRALGLALTTRVYALQPVFYFPLLKPLPDWIQLGPRQENNVRIFAWPTFYLPKWFKFLDSYWVSIAVERAIITLQTSGAIEDIDIIDAHFGYPEGVGCVRAARRLGKSVFITLRGLEADYPIGSRIYRQLARALRNADGCICVSHGLRALAIGAGATPEKVCVIHNAVDRVRFYPGHSDLERKKVGLEIGRPTVISVGHLLDVKRHHVLIKAFSHVREAMPDAKLVIVGRKMHEPEYPAYLQRLVQDLQLSDSVSLTGGLSPDEVATWLRASDVFALASRREGCCNAILEALASGLPVVATPAGDNGYFIHDGQNGYLTPFDDDRAFGDSLIAALRKTDWDRDRIVGTSPAGDWASVGMEVRKFFEDSQKLSRARNE